jgi:hypothetical protein
LNIAGLLLTLLGAIVAASGVIMSKQTAIEISSTYWDENLRLRAALLKQSRTAAGGLVLVALGTALQLCALLLSHN